ncbi:MAG TPA: tetratricopeptide repeat protein [Gemmataceae bacterium]|jgi:hypothetical protein
MQGLPFLFESTPLLVLQLGLTLWMLVDASHRRVEAYWYWIILIFQPLGAWAYFLVYKARDLRGGAGRLAGLLHRPPSLAELRHRAEHAPTVASRLELAERLVALGEFAEAVPLVEAVLAREPEHNRAAVLLARCRRGLGRPAEAVPLLKGVVARQPGWGEYAAWYLLIDCCREAEDPFGAVAGCRELAKAAPSLEHTCLLAEHLLAAGEPAAAKKAVEEALADYQYSTGQSRRRDRRWVGRAKRLLKQAG